MTRLPLLLCALALLSACPTFPDNGLYACKVDDDCVGEQRCLDGICVQPPDVEACADGRCGPGDCELCPSDCVGVAACDGCAVIEVDAASEPCECLSGAGSNPACGLCPEACPEQPTAEDCAHCVVCAIELACAPSEICDNGIDDDGDLEVDCQEADCQRYSPDWCGHCGDGICDPFNTECPSCPDCAGSEACEPERACTDGLDNDLDELFDCADGDCDPDAACESSLELCSNQFDDDQDGLVDCEDPGCALHGHCQPAAEDCTDGVDNDRDRAADCADVDCDFETACESGPDLCGNGFDDDGDLLADCDDAGCATSSACGGSTEVCDDQKDDDGDGLFDCEDPDCLTNPSCNGSPEICDNLADDDDDGLVDCEDPACVSSPGCAGVERCGNGEDDDSDGVADCWDQDCCDTPSCAHLPPSVCHGGQDCGSDVDTDGDGLRCRADLECQNQGDGPCVGQLNCVDGEGTTAIDCADVDCAGAGNCVALESNPAFIEGVDDASCSGGVDEDRDGRADCLDPSCNGVLAGAGESCEFYQNEANCGDGLDEDRDRGTAGGGVDCDDADCNSLPGCHAGNCPAELGPAGPLSSLYVSFDAGTWRGSYDGAARALLPVCGYAGETPAVILGFVPPASTIYRIDAVGSDRITSIAVLKAGDNTCAPQVTMQGDDAACSFGTPSWAGSGIGSFQLDAETLYYVVLLMPDAVGGEQLQLNLYMAN